MPVHPFTPECERRLKEGIAALHELGYGHAARAAQAVLIEQQRARAYRHGKM